MSVQKLEAIHQQLLAGTLSLDYDTAVMLDGLSGHRFDKKEKAVDLAIEADRVAGKIKWDDRGADRFFDVLKEDTQSRLSAFLQGAQAGGQLGGKIGGAIGGTVGAVGGAVTGFAAGGPVVAAQTGALGVVTVAIPTAVAAAGIGAAVGGAWYAIRD